MLERGGASLDVAGWGLRSLLCEPSSQVLVSSSLELTFLLTLTPTQVAAFPALRCLRQLRLSSSLIAVAASVIHSSKVGLLF